MQQKFKVKKKNSENKRGKGRVMTPENYTGSVKKT